MSELEISTSKVPALPDNPQSNFQFARRDVVLSNGNNDDVATQGYNYLRVTGPSAAFAIRGFAGGLRGAVMVVEIDVAQTLTISNLSTGSAMGNRIVTDTGADAIYNAPATLIFLYDDSYADLGAWKLLSAVQNMWQETEANIIAATKPSGYQAYATDTKYNFISLGGGSWMKSEFPFFLAAPNPDMGAIQDSPHQGYGPDYITDKLLANVDIGNAADTTRAGANRFPIRANNGYLQVYINGSWQNVVVNFVFAEAAAYGYALLHQPVGLSWWYEIMSGNSIYNLGMNGLPLVQGYVADMGALPSPQTIGGRTIA